MLKARRYKFSITAVLGAIAFFPLVFVLMGQTIPPKSNPKDGIQDKTDQGKSRPDLPSIAYTAERPLSEKEIRRTLKYDKYRILDTAITSDETETSFADWITSDSALPTEDSAVIVAGTVIEANAFLSKNKLSVFSQFNIEVERIFKDSGELLGKQLVAERDGGIVIYPTGFKTQYQISGQYMPIVGKNYVFFLTHKFPLYGKQNPDLYILTGYELTNGIVSPLDAANGGTHPTATIYKGTKETDLIQIC